MSIKKSSSENKKISSAVLVEKMQSQIDELQLHLAELIKQNEVLKLDNYALNQSADIQQHANLMYNSTSDIIFLMSVEPNDVYRCLSVNMAYLKFTGFKETDIIGKRVEEILPPEASNYILNKYYEAIQIGNAIQYEESHDFINGYVVLETNLTPIINNNGVCTHLRGVARDITEHKLAEDVRTKWLMEVTHAHDIEKKKQEALQIFHEIQILLSRIHDLDEFCLLAVELGRQKLKYDRISMWFRGESDSYIIGSYGIDEHGNLRNEKNNVVYVSPESNFGRIIANKTRCLMVENTDLRDQHANVVGKGTQIISALWDGDNIIGCMSVDNLLRNREISQHDAELFELYTTIIGHLYRQKVAEEALRKNVANQRAMIANISDVIGIISADGLNVYNSPNMEKWFGWKPEDMIGNSTIANIHENDQQNTRRVFEIILSKPNSPITGECKYKCKDGSNKWIKYTMVNLLNNPDIAGILVNYHDISERKLADNALADEKERLRVTLQSIGDGVIATDIDGRIIIINSIAEHITGYQQNEANGQILSDIFHVIDQYTRNNYEDISTRILQHGEIVEYKENSLLIARDGTERIIISHGTPIRDLTGTIIGAVLVFRDVTGEIQMRQDIQRISKLDSLGVMAGGIAHDFNNLLTAIAGNIGLAQWMIESNTQEDAVQCLKDAEDASLRARNLTQQLLTFAKGGVPVRDTVSLLPLIHESVALALTGSRNKCKIEVPESLWNVKADAGQLSQVLHNLLLNADQAMIDNGTITLIASNVNIKPESSSLLSGPFIRIDIIDSGIGIPLEIQDKIFDPFFTTKQSGTGLGLTSAYSIIHGHEGQIFVNSTPGHGSTFSILLPALPDVDSLKANEPEKSISFKPWRILVLDDEKVICKILKRVLESVGHIVTTVNDGNDAINEWINKPFDIGIFDLTIPGGIGGKEVITRIHEFDPTARAIASSGYYTDDIMANHEDYGFIRRLAKPYRVDEVLKLIKELQQLYS
jgi:PAS domain S-box-containing protein